MPQKKKFKYQNANNTTGILLRSYNEGPAIFRIYGKKGSFKDYEILHNDIGVKIMDDSVELLESLDGEDCYLDYSRKILGQENKYDRKKLISIKTKNVKSFSKTEFEKLWRAIEKMEGWGGKAGTIRAYQKKAQIIGVHLDKQGIIDRYNIEGYGWVTKDEGIALTQQGKVDAVVAISPNGHPFLRGRPHHAIS